ncbi:MAG: S1 RNA-binding domain-containing protein, partial [Planctomycetes bacterium]|nr:S1 RNA-binding domain-containing protein [Planctomycetota bacterium]
MVDRNLIREFNVDESELEKALGKSLEQWQDDAQMDAEYDERARSFDVNQIVDGVILRVDGDEVVVDIGYKSEGIVSIDEWSDSDEPPESGQPCQVLLEEVEDDFGLILLSKRKADRIRDWEKVIAAHNEGDIITGAVVRKIKGGLLVNIGVNVFLPASQVDIRRPHDIASYIGKDIECVILKIDEARRNIVVSRRKLIEEKRDTLKKALLAEIEEGQIRKGTVKNIADFGAFVDLGGIDGLLHITDMSWGRISHPSEVVKIDEDIEVMILNIDREKEKIALGLKQKFPSPWENIEERYPLGEKVQGEVVNVMSYGAFVKLEGRIEGFEAFRGKLGKSAKTLGACCKFDAEFEKEAEKLGSYAFLRASEQAVQTSYHSWKLAKSPLLPQAFAQLQAFGRNVRGFEGLIADKVLNGGLSVRQMIYDDARVTDYKSEGRLYEGSQEAFEVDRLDVLAEAGGAFLNL